jgi:hypothetical protein
MDQRVTVGRLGQGRRVLGCAVQVRSVANRLHVDRSILFIMRFGGMGAVHCTVAVLLSASVSPPMGAALVEGPAGIEEP